MATFPIESHLLIGSLDLYDARVHPWSADEIGLATAFADIAGSCVEHSVDLDRLRRTVDQLQHALDSRVIIEQAKGMLAADAQISVDEAFARLRKHANDHNASLRSVADAVVNLGLRPEPDRQGA